MQKRCSHLTVLIAAFLLATTTSTYAQKADLTALSNQVAKLHKARKFDQAIGVAERLLKQSEVQLGVDHPSVGIVLGNLAGLYRTQGRLSEAGPLYERALSIQEKTHGPDHLKVSAALQNLAGLRVAQGDYATAEPLYKRSLAIRQKRLGPEHIKTSIVLNNLAELNRNLGRYDLALPLYERSLAVREKKLGVNHPAVSSALHNLARLHGSLGRYGKAEPLYLRAIDIQEKKADRNDRVLSIMLNSLAALYTKQGRYVLAEPLYKRALTLSTQSDKSRNKTLGGALNNLAELYRLQGRHAEAEPLYKRALAIREKEVGPEHVTIAILLNNLAGLYRSLVRYEEAEALYKRSLVIREKRLGADHLNVGVSLNNLGELYRTQRRYAEAEPLFQRALAIVEKALGEDHPTVGNISNNLAVLYRAQGRPLDAEHLHKKALSIAEKAHGRTHPHVGESLNNLATIYRAENRFADAEPLYRRALSIQENAFGPYHPSVGTALRNLKRLYQNWGKPEKLRDIQKRLAQMPAPGTRHVPLYFVTNRSSKTAMHFGPGLSRNVSFGRAVVQIPQSEVSNRAQRIGESMGRIESAESGHLTAAEALKFVRIQSLGSAGTFARAIGVDQKRAAIFKNQALVFVHGYNNSFVDAMKRATQVSFDLQFDGVLVPFSWPSQGSVSGYLTDQDMAKNSIDMFADALVELRRHMPATRFHFLAHSMGNQVLMNALCKLARRKTEGEPNTKLFGQVISAHADIDPKNFAKLTACIKPRAEGVTLYVNEKDTALRLRCGGRKCRAGNFARAYAAADVVDTTEMGQGFWKTLSTGFDHDVFVRNPLLFGDITRLLLSGQRPVEKRTPEFQPKKDEVGKIYWAYDRTHDATSRIAKSGQ